MPPTPFMMNMRTQLKTLFDSWINMFKEKSLINGSLMDLKGISKASRVGLLAIFYECFYTTPFYRSVDDFSGL